MVFQNEDRQHGSLPGAGRSIAVLKNHGNVHQLDQARKRTNHKPEKESRGNQKMIDPTGSIIHSEAVPMADEAFTHIIILK